MNQVSSYTLVELSEPNLISTPNPYPHSHFHNLNIRRPRCCTQRMIYLTHHQGQESPRPVIPLSPPALFMIFLLLHLLSLLLDRIRAQTS